jgi:hypothetical protein
MLLSNRCQPETKVSIDMRLLMSNFRIVASLVVGQPEVDLAPCRSFLIGGEISPFSLLTVVGEII